MVKKEIEHINAGSMADIAFLLLIFFLVSTTMSIDKGINRILPEYQNIPPIDIKSRNLMEIFINRNNEIMVEQETMSIKDLKAAAKEFILNPENKSDLPEITYEKDSLLGNVRVARNHVISLKSDRGTSYETYITVQNELTAAYNELRDEMAVKKFGSNYDALSAKQKNAICKVLPMRISEAEIN